jgi:hypothetical protein
VAELIKSLDSDDFRIREDATLALMQRPDARPALLVALRSSSAEVRKRARRVLDVFQPELAKRRARQLLNRVKNGEVDQVIEHMVDSSDRVEDAVWAELVRLAERIRARANLEHKKSVPFPPLGKSRRLATADKIANLDKDRDLDGWNALARSVRDRVGVVRCVLVSQGPVHCHEQIAHSLVFANGDVEVRRRDGPGAGSIHDSIVFCDGSVTTADVARCIIIATGTVTIRGANEGNVVVIQNARDVLGLKLFNTSQVGIETEESGGRVLVKNLWPDRPFAKAGFRVGDQLTEVNGEKLRTREHFRRLVRHARSVDDSLSISVRRAGRPLKLALAFVD